MTRRWVPCAALCLLLAAPEAAEAFCGFYVSGSGENLFNNATQVVLMREGTRTVLAMQNNYQGPPQNFAMVVPVPVILQKENVKTLTKEVFEKVDRLTSPRLVEYWEQDPCFQPRYEEERAMPMMKMAPSAARAGSGAAADYGVTVEAQFTVGEYEIVILSAKDALGLDRYLRDNRYKIPEGAEPLFRPYIQQGMKFFVAKVDVSKVRFNGDQAMLSPLRFHYDSEQFALPVRLGLVNAKDAQDLIVHILARGQRYEVANFPNVTIPTNIDLKESAKTQFAQFYASLFDLTLENTPKAVVTEYAWDSASCDPCPSPPLAPGDLTTLGLDVLDGKQATVEPDITINNLDKLSPEEQQLLKAQVDNLKRMVQMRRSSQFRRGGNFVVTRLHARYDKRSLGEDLVFRAAPPIAGGREFLSNGGKLEQGSVSAGVNNFQARYAVRHPWVGEVACSNPRRGIWGGPPNGGGIARPMAASKTAFVERKASLAPELAESPVAELRIRGVKAFAGEVMGGAPAPKKKDSSDKLKKWIQEGQ